MAALKIMLHGISGREIQADRICSYELSRDISAPCDALRLRFISEKPLEEICGVSVFFNGEKVFFGYCDAQSEEVGKGGITCSLYARSSASLLVDNEAVPGTFCSPSVRAMFLINAEKFGFTLNLPKDCYCSGDFLVRKGTSCYSALNDIAYANTGRSLAVSPENEICLPLDGERVIKDADIISEKRIINRGRAVSALDYKMSGDEGYIRHLESRSIREAGIMRTRKTNLSALPEWQRSRALITALKQAARDYSCYEVTLRGCCEVRLYERVIFDRQYFTSCSGYTLKGITHVYDGSGERTLLRLYKDIDLKEINYVAE